MAMQKKGLGRGLSALIPSAELKTESRAEQTPPEIAVDRITPSPFQPRRSFDEAKIEELASSIRNQGIIQPLVVRPKGDGFELIAGERRWRAAMKAGLSRVPVVIREASDHEALQLALVENLQREDLNAIEEANGYRRLQEEFQWSQEEMAERVGKSRPAIANSLRMLSSARFARSTHRSLDYFGEPRSHREGTFHARNRENGPPSAYRTQTTTPSFPHGS